MVARFAGIGCRKFQSPQNQAVFSAKTSRFRAESAQESPKGPNSGHFCPLFEDRGASTKFYFAATAGRSSEFVVKFVNSKCHLFSMTYEGETLPSRCKLCRFHKGFLRLNAIFPTAWTLRSVHSIGLTHCKISSFCLQNGPIPGRGRLFRAYNLRGMGRFRPGGRDNCPGLSVTTRHELAAGIAATAPCW